MNTLYFLVTLAIVIPVIALLGHLYVAYRLAPERAKQSILDALVNDPGFQDVLMQSVLKNFLSVHKDASGNDVVPIDLIIARAKESFKHFFNTQSVEMGKEIDQVMETGAMGQNPLLGIVLSQIPKKYRGILLMAMNLMQNNGQSWQS